jgi:hypothetical protein
MFECNDTIIDEELLLNDELKQQEYEENSFYDENFNCKLFFFINSYKKLLINEILADEPLDLSKKSKIKQNDEEQYLELNENNNGQSSSSFLVDNQKSLKFSQFSSKSQHQLALVNATCRRNYSKEELDKALADIQSGRIGTY